MRISADQRTFARQLRRNSTDAERRLWRCLRCRQLSRFRFRRQHPIGPYFADFVCLELRLVIELDGGQHNSVEGLRHDAVRSDLLAAYGYAVLRFWDNDVLQRTESVLDAIWRECEARARKNENGPRVTSGATSAPLPAYREK